MRKTITQRELRKASGKIMRALGRGETFVLMSKGVPVGELRPIARHRFVPVAEVVAGFAAAPPIDRAGFRRDLDAVIDQSLIPPAGFRRG